MLKKALKWLQPWVKGAIQLLTSTGIGALRGLMYSVPIITLTSALGPIGWLVAVIGVIFAELSWTYAQWRHFSSKNWWPLACVLPATMSLSIFVLWTTNPWIIVGLWLGWVGVAFGLLAAKEFLDKHWGPMPAVIQTFVTAVDCII